MFNSSLIGEFRQKESMSCADLAKLLDIGKSHLSMIERGERKPSLELGYRLINVTRIPIEKWVDSDSLPENEEEISTPTRDDASAIASVKNRLNREHRERVEAKERVSELEKHVWELEQTHERLTSEIRLRVHFENIVCAKFPLRSMKLRSWTTRKTTYECRFVDSGVLASSPGEAALCLKCFDCLVLESGECVGHGNETYPENIVDLLDRLEKYGVYDGVRQAQILKKYYKLTLSPQEISNIRYRVRKGLPVKNDVFYIDVRKNKR